MIVKKIKLNIGTLLTGVIFLVLASSTVAWTLADKTPPAWDPADHISAAYDYYRPVAHFDLRGFAREFFIEPHYYAPFVHLVSAIIFLVLGASRLTGIAVNLISLAVLLASVTWMGRTLYGHNAVAENGSVTEQAAMRRAEADPGILAGMMAALIASCYHFSAWLMHDAFLDFPLIAIVAAAFALLIRAGDFQNRRAAIMFGVVAGCGMLTKQTFAFFFLLPAVYVTAKVLLARNGRAIFNLALAAAVIILISSIWYLPHMEEVLAIYRVNKDAAASENEAPLFTFASNAFYLHALVSGQMQLPFGLLFLCGLVYSLIHRRKQSTLLYLWFASGIGIFTLIANKDIRYTVPVLPAAALISVCWLSDARLISSIKRVFEKATAPPIKRSDKVVVALKMALAAAIVAWAMVSFFNAQWPRPGAGFYVDTPRFRWMVFARNYYGFDHRPMQDDWRVPDIVRFVAKLPLTDRSNDASGNDASGAARPVLGVVVNLPHLNPSSLALYARLLADEPAGFPLINIDWLIIDSARDRIEACDYVLVRTGLEHAEWVAPMERYVEELIRSHPERFTPVGSFPIPLNHAEAVIYRCGG